MLRWGKADESVGMGVVCIEIGGCELKPERATVAKVAARR